jgi:hypothetical protein
MLYIKSRKVLKKLNFILVILLVTFYKNNYILHEFWPSLDMITFFPTYFTKTDFGMDFMTSCFEDFTGRYFFGNITGFVYPFFDDWFDFLLFYRILIFLFLPLSWYLALNSLFKQNRLDLPLTLILIASAFIAPGLNSWVSIFSFSTWSPYFFHFHPGTISSILVLFGIFFGFKDNPKKFISHILIILGALAHPIFSISVTFIFIFSKYFIDKEIKSVLSLFALNASVIIFQSIFSNFGNLDLESYLIYFAKFHPHHYIPSSEPFLVDDVITIAMLFLIVYLIPKGENSKEFKILTISFFAFFFLGLFFQYFFIERYPISKFLILLSPSRFSSYIYWMFTIVIIFKFRRALSKLDEYSDKILNVPTLLVFLILNITIFFMQFNTINESGRFEKYYYLNQNEIEVIEWSKNNTSTDDLFLVLGSHRLNVFFTIETERGQYNAIGYPFSDECIEENFSRKNNFYYKPLPEIIDFLSENKSIGFSYFITEIRTDTKELEIVFSNNQFKVLKLLNS